MLRIAAAGDYHYSALQIPSEDDLRGGNAVGIGNGANRVVAQQLGRTPRPLPTMEINPDVKSIFDFKYEDFTLCGYDPWPAIKAPVAV